ncbi:hypothetical protein OYE22_13845 [Streptomyces sp. 71268]|uniref:hypothetical protein n=1 Tax=Streptomyces sp. 71268 TaxID=3002640 RepID=UPI0023F6D918|nr:hypothetical protein [Streptomyces sp. 71268]WEV26162.1 hypothetical protein OYE22_13845 [Streptomyces sp. 71268]
MREIVGIVGIVVAIQGTLGVVGRVVGEKPWGVLQQWFDIPSGGYVALVVVGLVLAAWGESGRASRKRA